MHRNLLLALFGGAALLAQPQSPQQGTPMGQPPASGTSRTISPLDRPGYPDDTQMPNRIDEKRFVKDALQSGLTDVELAKVAVNKATSDSIKQFAQKTIDDRSKTNDELKQIASNEKINVPDSLDSKQQSKIDKMSKLSGADFDRAYMKDQVKNQQNELREFQQEAQRGNDPQVKSFASKTVAALDENVKTAKELEKGGSR